jgi:hypothetical protein
VYNYVPLELTNINITDGGGDHASIQCIFKAVKFVLPLSRHQTSEFHFELQIPFGALMQVFDTTPSIPMDLMFKYNYNDDALWCGSLRSIGFTEKEAFEVDLDLRRMIKARFCKKHSRPTLESGWIEPVLQGWFDNNGQEIFRFQEAPDDYDVPALPTRRSRDNLRTCRQESSRRREEKTPRVHLRQALLFL